MIYRENYLLPGARELIAHLLESASLLLFLTNNSVPTPDDSVVKLERLGICCLNAGHFYTSAMNNADFLAEMHPKCTSFALGKAGLMAAPPGSTYSERFAGAEQCDYRAGYYNNRQNRQGL